MHRFVYKSIKLNSTKALVAILIGLIACSNFALTSGEAAKPVDARLTAASSKFAFKLYGQLLKEHTAKNTFVSPASVMLALAMTYNGADGETRKAMARTLEIENMSLEEVNRAFANLKTTLTPTDAKVQLRIANSIWTRSGFRLNPAFVERNKQAYGAEIASLDFSQPTAAETINSWVSRNTEGKIDKIIAADIDSDMMLFLINAIYFKAQWKTEFKKEKTKPDTFKLGGDAQKQLPMMSQSGTYFYYKGENFQSVALPYGNGSVSMFIFLPNDGTALDQFERNLTADNWDTWMKSFALTPGDVMLPRFKVQWESKLNESLKALGMAEAFSTNANFSQMAEVGPGRNLYITEVRHKTWCEVNEEGTEAAAATSVAVGVASVQEPREKFVMKVDHPFFFAIRDNQTGVVLFMGSVTDPG